MKISELSTDRALDVLCELTPYVANITGDKALLDELGKKFDTKGKSVAEMYTFAAQKCAALAPVLLKAHRYHMHCRAWSFSALLFCSHTTDLCAAR